MNSFWKGFFSLFDWMFPRSMEEQLNELDNSMQSLYDKMGWGEYKKPSHMSGWNNAIDFNMQNDILNQTYIYSGRKIVTLGEDMKNSLPNDVSITSTENLYVKDIGEITLTTSKEFLDEMVKLVPSEKFQPYAYYNADMDSIQVYFKDNSSYTQPLNQNVELHLSHDTDEITGATILNIKQLIENNK